MARSFPLVSLLLFIIVAAIGVSRAQTATADPWAIVRTAIDTYPFLKSMSVSVTNSSGRVFTHTKGVQTMDYLMNVASSSKWPSGVAIMRVVQTGVVDLDAPICTYLKWWACTPVDSKDFRHKVTLRSLLTFTSGYEDTEMGMGGNTCPNDASTYQDCTRGIYENRKVHKHAPLTKWAYNSYHLNIAGAVAEAASGTPIIEILDSLLRDLNMTSSAYCLTAMSSCANKTHRVVLAGSLDTTGNDYEKFLKAMSTKTVPHLSAQLVQEMEGDWPAGVTPSGPMATFVSFGVGHYGMTNWLECLLSDPWNIRASCKSENIRADPGMWGFYPYVHPTKNYLFQIATFEPPLGIVAGILLRLEIGFLVERALGLKDSSCAGEAEAARARTLLLPILQKGNLTSAETLLADAAGVVSSILFH